MPTESPFGLPKEEENDNEVVDPKGTKLTPLEGKHVVLFLQSIIGLLSYKTLKLKGKMGVREVIVRVDNETTHNFISIKVIHECGLQVQPTKQFGLFWGNGFTFLLNIRVSKLTSCFGVSGTIHSHVLQMGFQNIVHVVNELIERNAKR